MHSVGRRNHVAPTSRTGHRFGLLVLAALATILIVKSSDAAVVVRARRSATSDDHYAYADGGGGGNAYDRININYDEYPMVVPKRAALLLDRLMVALHHALEDGDKDGVRRIGDLYKQSVSRKQTSANKQQSLSPYRSSSDSPSSSLYSTKETPSKFVPNFSFDGVADESFASGYLDAPPAAKPTDGRPRQQKQQMNEEMMGMQRRGHAGEALGANKGHVYWRCYFNAVSCF